ncbi:hypothetical protein OROMI_010207 [Orobanche minor]
MEKLVDSNFPTYVIWRLEWKSLHGMAMLSEQSLPEGDFGSAWRVTTDSTRFETFLDDVQWGWGDGSGVTPP